MFPPTCVNVRVLLVVDVSGRSNQNRDRRPSIYSLSICNRRSAALLHARSLTIKVPPRVCVLYYCCLSCPPAYCTQHVRTFVRSIDRCHLKPYGLSAFIVAAPLSENRTEARFPTRNEEEGSLPNISITTKRVDPVFKGWLGMVAMLHVPL